MTYTPPVGRFATTDEDQAAYLAGHERGWGFADFAAAYGAKETVEVAATRWVDDRADSGEWEHHSRTYLRAREGFTDGAQQYADDDHDS